MTPKRKPARRARRPVKVRSFDPENTQYFTPVVFAVILVSVIVLFREFLFSDKMLYGSDMITAGIFMRSLYINYMAEFGKLLQWNPYIFGGIPYVEAFHGDIFYPFSILKFFGSIYRMVGYSLVIHILFSSLFMYLCARQFKLQKVPALLAAICYMVGPYLVSLVAPGHEGKVFVTTLFPLVMLFLDRAFERRPFMNFTFMGMVIGIIIVSPHPQMSYFTLWGVSFYAAFKLINIVRDQKSIGPAVKPALLVTYAVLIGLLLSAIQFFPGYQYTTHFSPRADAKRGWEWATSWSMHEEDAMSLLIPEFVGVNAGNSETYYWGKNHFKDNSDVAGTSVFFLALIGFFFYRRRESYFFGGLALFALLYALAGTTPVFKIFYYLIPKVQSLRAASMIMFLFLFSVSLLAGMGLQHVIDSYRKRKKEIVSDRRFNYLLWGFPGLLLLLAVLFSANGRGMLSLWSSLFYSEAATIQIQQGVTKLDVAYLNLPAIQSGAWFAFLATALIALFIWLYRSGKAGMGVLVALLAVPLVNGMRFDSRFIRTFDQDRQWASNPMTDFFTSRPDKFRVLNLMNPNESILPFHGVEVVVGYHGNQLRWYDDLIGGMGLSNVNWPRTNPNVLNLIGTKYILIPPNQALPANFFGEIPLRSVATYGQNQIVENPNAFPRVFLVDSFRVFQDRQDIYPNIEKNVDDLKKVVYLEQDPGIDLVHDTVGTDSVWIDTYEPDSVFIRCTVSTNKILVLTDNYYDAWHVTVDGRPAELLRADGAFRAVALPSGSGEVLFTYDSPRYATGRLITLLTSIYLLGVVGFYFVLNIRRKGRQSEQ